MEIKQSETSQIISQIYHRPSLPFSTMNKDWASADFDFYLKFTKPLVLALPSVQDKILAAAWIKKLIDDSAAPDLKITFLKVLLLSLQKKKLCGVFKQHPQDLAITEKNLMVFESKKRKIETPGYSYDVSPDLLQYVAVQEIKDFGVHAFYAMSNNPIESWDHTDDLVLPRAVSRSEEMTGSWISGGEKPKPKPEDTAEMKKKKRDFAKSILKTVQAEAPSQPIGKVLAEGKQNEDTWQRPNWSSNLVLVDEMNSSAQEILTTNQ